MLRHLLAELHDSVDELRQAVVGFVRSHNTQWSAAVVHEAAQEAVVTAVTLVETAAM
jgi:hypothetical protein